MSEINTPHSTPASANPPLTSKRASGKKKRGLGTLAVLALLVLAAGGAWWALGRTSGDVAPKTDAAASAGSGQGAPGSPGAGQNKGPGGNRPQPISAMAAKRQDVNVTVPAIGTITALQTAAVRSRVDGELFKLHFQEGSLVQQGQLLAELDHRPYLATLEQAKGLYERDAASLKNAELDLKRYTELVASDSVSKQQLDTQEALVKQLKGTVANDKAAVDSAKVQLDYSYLNAPLSGRLGLRLIDLGNVVHASDTTGVVSITQTQPISLVFSVPEIYLPQINKKLKAKQGLPVFALDREQKRPLAKGQLTITDNAIDTTTGTIKLKALFPNKDNSLFPNQFVNVRLQIDTEKDALVVPVNAIQRGSMGTFVYQVKEDSTVTLKKVKTRAVDGDWVSVEGDVKPGDRLVTDGADRLREGAKVEVIESARPTESARPKAP